MVTVPILRISLNFLKQTMAKPNSFTVQSQPTYTFLFLFDRETHIYNFSGTRITTHIDIDEHVPIQRHTAHIASGLICLVHYQRLVTTPHRPERLVHDRSCSVPYPAYR